MPVDICDRVGPARKSCIQIPFLLILSFLCVFLSFALSGGGRVELNHVDAHRGLCHRNQGGASFDVSHVLIFSFSFLICCVHIYSCISFSIFTRFICTFSYVAYPQTFDWGPTNFIVTTSLPCCLGFVFANFMCGFIKSCVLLLPHHSLVIPSLSSLLYAPPFLRPRQTFDWGLEHYWEDEFTAPQIVSLTGGNDDRPNVDESPITYGEIFLFSFGFVKVRACLMSRLSHFSFRSISICRFRGVTRHVCVLSRFLLTHSALSACRCLFAIFAVCFFSYVLKYLDSSAACLNSSCFAFFARPTAWGCLAHRSAGGPRSAAWIAKCRRGAARTLR